MEKNEFIRCRLFLFSFWKTAYAVIPAVVTTLFVISCQDAADNTEHLDYDGLIELNAEVILDTAEDEEYFPGSLRDLFVASDGAILVSDLQRTTIEQFDASGSHMGTVAEEGGGPGEISSFNFSFVDGGNDTLIIHRIRDIRRDYFVKDEAGKYRFIAARTVDDQNMERLFRIIGRRSGSEFYTRIDDYNRSLEDIEKPFSISTVGLTDKSDNKIVDSLAWLKIPNPYIRMSSEAVSVFSSLPFQYQDRFIVMEDGGYLIARPDSSVLVFYDRNFEQAQRISLDVVERPVERADLDFTLRDYPRDVRRDIEDRISHLKPPFLNIWSSDNRIWMYTDVIEERGKQYVVLNMDTTPVGKFYLSDTDDVRFIRSNRVYSLYHDPDIGHGVRVYEVHL